MQWVLLSLLSAFGESFRDALGKKVISQDTRIAVLWLSLLFSLPWFIAAVSAEGVPIVPNSYWVILLVGGALGALAQYLYVSALALSDLSLLLPLLAFTPVFMLLTSPLMIGEVPTLQGLSGVLLIVAGSYLMNLTGRGSGLFAPFNALLSEAGARRMLAVAFIWSITANFDKVGIKMTSPAYWLLTVVAAIALFLTPLALSPKAQVLRTLRRHGIILVIAGSMFGVALLCQMTAVKLAPVAYVVSLKRTSAIFGVFFGYLFFRERKLRQRLIGASIMVIGVSLIAVS